MPVKGRAALFDPGIHFQNYRTKDLKRSFTVHDYSPPSLLTGPRYTYEGKQSFSFKLAWSDQADDSSKDIAEWSVTCLNRAWEVEEYKRTWRLRPNGLSSGLVPKGERVHQAIFSCTLSHRAFGSRSLHMTSEENSSFEGWLTGGASPIAVRPTDDSIDEPFGNTMAGYLFSTEGSIMGAADTLHFGRVIIDSRLPHSERHLLAAASAALLLSPDIR